MPRSREVVLELERAVEVVDDGALAAAGDHDHLLDPAGDRLLDAVLDRRLVDERQHLFRLRLGDRQESRAETGGGKDRLADAWHVIGDNLSGGDTLTASGRGSKGALERVVEGDLITTHVGGKGVFATPAMIGLMEGASHRSVEGLLPDGPDDRRLRGARPPPGAGAAGQHDRGHQPADRGQGQQALFDVSCALGDKLLGSGTHKRAIVPANF